MLRLPPKMPEAEWLDVLPGVRVQFAPIGPKSFRAAQQACLTALNADAEDKEEASDEMSRELIRRGIMAWEGVGNAHGDPVAVTPEAVELFLSDPLAFAAACSVYTTPFFIRNAEGNGFAGSLDGTGAEATPASDTATSSATQDVWADVKDETMQQTPQTPASTDSTSVSPTKPKRSGT
ncbi:hypothetical protein PQ455_01465 [Sphingomonas naphthae]|uniref:Uncharacterized protein n=1 Tax=Sphingomonas naphthae TaxID=1813468 RepID=A0ABY7TQ04_9SPHN|nr:hypothetical protein [Sphingomonas naphthae]WCT73929.1 hypothetical protein PQ455_01465 [Sphingomonas naphthae]